MLFEIIESKYILTLCLFANTVATHDHLLHVEAQWLPMVSQNLDNIGSMLMFVSIRPTEIYYNEISDKNEI